MKANYLIHNSRNIFTLRREEVFGVHAMMEADVIDYDFKYELAALESF